jgi:cell division inhibitor SepF
MTNGYLKRSLKYLGLIDDEYDDDDSAPPEYSDSSLHSYQSSSGGRHLSKRSVQTINPSKRQPSSAVSVITPHRAPVVATEPTPAVRTVTPTEFADATQIGDRLKADQPVIVNLQDADRDLKRRMIDFCSGLTYALSGGMERVGDNVFLITPSGADHAVEVEEVEEERWEQLG